MNTQIDKYFEYRANEILRYYNNIFNLGEQADLEPVEVFEINFPTTRSFKIYNPATFKNANTLLDYNQYINMICRLYYIQKIRDLAHKDYSVLDLKFNNLLYQYKGGKAAPIYTLDLVYPSQYNIQETVLNEYLTSNILTTYSINHIVQDSLGKINSGGNEEIDYISLIRQMKDNTIKIIYPEDSDNGESPSEEEGEGEGEGERARPNPRRRRRNRRRERRAN